MNVDVMFMLSCIANPTDKLYSTNVFTIGGWRLTTGVYCTPSGAFLLSSGLTLKLDAKGDSSAGFTFIAASTFTSLPYTTVQLMNGASAGNVYWFIGSSATIGDYAVMVGNIIAYASITFNSYSTLSGRGLAGAAITCASGSTIALTLQTSTVAFLSPTPKPFAVNLFGCSNLVLEAQSAITFGGAHTSVTGDIGISPGTSITGDYGQSTYGTTHINDAYARSCMVDMRAILAQSAGQACMNIAAELGEHRQFLLSQ